MVSFSSGQRTISVYLSQRQSPVCKKYMTIASSSAAITNWDDETSSPSSSQGSEPKNNSIRADITYFKRIAWVPAGLDRRAERELREANPFRYKDENAIRAEIKALEAEKEALRAEKRAERELRKAARINREGHSSKRNDLVLYETERYNTPEEEYTLVRRERIEEPEGSVRIEKDKKGRMGISVPNYYIK